MNTENLAQFPLTVLDRHTHSNILFPGPGIGGYCLPKDGGLGVWAYHTLLGFEDDIFKITPMAIDINDTRSLRATSTDNRFGRHNTNVVKLYQALDCGENQKCFYDPGIGAYTPAGKIRNLLGKMSGIHDTPRP